MNQMRYKLFGKSGLRVSELCLGTLTFGEEWGQGADKKESEKVFRAFQERGGNFLDTANKYNNGTSEEWTGEFIANDRERWVVATKYSLNMSPGDPNAGGTHRKSMMRSVEDSLRRLKTDYIDVYWLHQWDDYATPMDEIMRGLDDLVSQGKVLYVGISDTPAWLAAHANTLADLRGWTRFVGLQIEYSLVERTPEREYMPMADYFDMAVTPWGILGQSLLSGKFHEAEDISAPEDTKRAKTTAHRVTERNLNTTREAAAIAREIGKSLPQVAINWLRQHSPRIIPIIGARTEKQALDNLGCLEFTLSEAHMKRLDEVSKVDMGFPHQFMALERIIDQRHGGTQHLIEGLRFPKG